MDDEKTLPPTTTTEENLASADARAESSLKEEENRKANALELAGLRFSAIKRLNDLAAEDALAKHGQRRINIIWESTQAILAVTVPITTLLTSAYLVLRGESSQATAAFVFLSSATNLVIGFYFGRTNHTKQGGVAPQRRGE